MSAAHSDDVRWEDLDAPAKLAMRWALAVAQVRLGGTTQLPLVGTRELVAGILLADLRGNPARILLDHFRIAPGAVLAQVGMSRVTPEKLASALENVPDAGLPPLDDTVAAGLHQLHRGSKELISLRDLFGITLHGDSDVAVQLTAQGVDVGALARAYPRYLAGRTSFADFLRVNFRGQEPRIQLPAYLPDQNANRAPLAEQQTDLVGVQSEIDAFAYLIASKQLVPPLAVGLFGAWGSGKSYFLRGLQHRIERVARETRAQQRLGSTTEFHEHVVQIEFNAWQYVGGNLWASLLEHLFRNLRRTSDESDDLLAERQRYWSERVETAAAERHAADNRRRELERDREAAAETVEQEESERAAALQRLEEEQRRNPLTGTRLSRELVKPIKAALAKAGLTAIDDEGAALAAELDRAKQSLSEGRTVLAPLRAKGWRYNLALLGMVLFTPLLVLLLQKFDVSPLISAIGGLMATATMYLKFGVNLVAKATKAVAAAKERLDAEADRRRSELDEKVATAADELAAIEVRLAAAVAQEAELAEKVAELNAELAAATPRRVLSEFLADRLATEDYRRHLGIPALVRRDLERLSQLVARQQHDPGSEAVEETHAIDRIVLYVDDLDRCPTELVIQVLEAVHLLLAFPLFVVVVAVDEHWLASSLRAHYEQLTGKDAGPEDYLEKIFQVPFRVLPLGGSSRRRMLRTLMEPNLFRHEATNTDAPTARARAEVPEADQDEFRHLVESFAHSSRVDPVWPGAVGLSVTPLEITQVEDAVALIGATPRAVKRFVNTYLLAKSMGLARGWEVPADGQLAVLLALATSHPCLLDSLIPEPSEPSDGTWPLKAALPARSATTPQKLLDAIDAVEAWLAENPQRADLDLVGAGTWKSLVSRFRLSAD